MKIKKTTIVITSLLFIAVAYCLFKNTFKTREYFLLHSEITSLSNLQNDQIIQQSASGGQTLYIEGRTGFYSSEILASVKPDSQYLVNASHWQILDSIPSFSFFKGKIKVLTGWNNLYLASKNKNKSMKIFTPTTFGIGELFIIAGQSNALGQCPVLFKPHSGFVKHGFINSKNEITWKDANDPQGMNGEGSQWPLVGDNLYSRLHIPIGFINVAKSGSSITQWQKGTDYYDLLLNIIRQNKHYGMRAILWQQGESDLAMDQNKYYTLLRQLIFDLREETKMTTPWVIALTSYRYGKISMEVQAAQKKVCGEQNIFEGPNTDKLDKEYRWDNTHFNERGTIALATRWTERIIETFFSEK